MNVKTDQKTKTLEQHLLYALLLGLFFRLLSAYFVYGPQALDDYFHGIMEASKFYLTGTHDLPEYRSPFLVWLLGGWLKLVSLFAGGDELSTLWQIRWMMGFLGLVSLVGIYGTYLYVREFSDPIFQRLAVYFSALYCLIPFVSTRAFGESFALCFVTLSFGLLLAPARMNFGRIFLGFLALGFATLLRFHVGLLYMLFFVWILIGRRWSFILPFFLAGFITLAAEIGIDYFDGRAFLSTLLYYLTENQDTTKYGVQPFHTTWVTWLGMMLFPFTLVLLPAWKKVWSEHRALFLMVLIFVFMHSTVPHKEERFLYPILGLSLILWTALWGVRWQTTRAVRVYTGFVFLLNAFVLVVVSLSNTQSGEVTPVARISQLSKDVLFVDLESVPGKGRFRDVFVAQRERFISLAAVPSTAEVASLRETKGYRDIALLTSREDWLGGVEKLRSDIEAQMGLRCTPLQRENSFLDDLIYKMNPKSNQRRRPTWWSLCSQSGI